MFDASAGEILREQQEAAYMMDQAAQQESRLLLEDRNSQANYQGRWAGRSTPENDARLAAQVSHEEEMVRWYTSERDKHQRVARVAQRRLANPVFYPGNPADYRDPRRLGGYVLGESLQGNATEFDVLEAIEEMVPTERPAKPRVLF